MRLHALCLALLVLCAVGASGFPDPYPSVINYVPYFAISEGPVHHFNMHFNSPVSESQWVDYAEIQFWDSNTNTVSYTCDPIACSMDVRNNGHLVSIHIEYELAPGTYYATVGPNVLSYFDGQMDNPVPNVGGSGVWTFTVGSAMDPPGAAVVGMYPQDLNTNIVTTGDMFGSDSKFWLEVRFSAPMALGNGIIRVVDQSMVEVATYSVGGAPNEGVYAPPSGSYVLVAVPRSAYTSSPQSFAVEAAMGALVIAADQSPYVSFSTIPQAYEMDTVGGCGGVTGLQSLFFSPGSSSDPNNYPGGPLPVLEYVHPDHRTLAIYFNREVQLTSGSVSCSINDQNGGFFYDTTTDVATVYDKLVVIELGGSFPGFTDGFYYVLCPGGDVHYYNMDDPNDMGMWHGVSSPTAWTFEVSSNNNNIDKVQVIPHTDTMSINMDSITVAPSTMDGEYIWLAFSSPVVLGTGMIYLEDEFTLSQVYSLDVANNIDEVLMVTSTGFRLKFPTHTLQSDVNYRLTWDPSAFQHLLMQTDFAPIDMASMRFSFGGGSGYDVQLLDVSPGYSMEEELAGAASYFLPVVSPQDRVFSMYFNVDVIAQMMNCDIYEASTQIPVVNFATDAAIASKGKIVEITLLHSFAGFNLGEHYVTCSSGSDVNSAFPPADPNYIPTPWAGFSDTNRWRFMVGDSVTQDTEYMPFVAYPSYPGLPESIASSPSEYEYEHFQIHFSEPVALGDGSMVVMEYNSNNILMTTSVTGGQADANQLTVSLSGYTATLRVPMGLLQANTMYLIEYMSGTFVTVASATPVLQSNPWYVQFGGTGSGACNGGSGADCSSYTSCTSCQGNNQCDWCESDGMCVQAGDFGSCFGGILHEGTYCTAPSHLAPLETLPNLNNAVDGVQNLVMNFAEAVYVGDTSKLLRLFQGPPEESDINNLNLIATYTANQAIVENSGFSVRVPTPGLVLQPSSQFYVIWDQAFVVPANHVTLPWLEQDATSWRFNTLYDPPCPSGNNPCPADECYMRSCSVTSATCVRNLAFANQGTPCDNNSGECDGQGTCVYPLAPTSFSPSLASGPAAINVGAFSLTFAVPVQVSNPSLNLRLYQAPPSQVTSTDDLSLVATFSSSSVELLNNNQVVRVSLGDLQLQPSSLYYLVWDAGFVDATSTVISDLAAPEALSSWSFITEGVVECPDGSPCPPDECLARACLTSENKCVRSMDFVDVGATCAQGTGQCNQQGTCLIDLCAGVTCPEPTEPQCQTSECDSFSGCQLVNINEGYACNDGVLGSVAVCSAGVCVSVEVCPGFENEGLCVAADPQCQSAACTDQGCVQTFEQDGTPCDDGFAHTNDDQCQNGFCVGTFVDLCENVVVPDSGDPCQENFCDPNSGDIEVWFPTGAACDDQDSETTSTCAGGQCVSSPICDFSCDDSNVPQCRRVPVPRCFISSGSCREYAIDYDAVGTSCDDGDDQTENDVCTDEGYCVGAPIVPCGGECIAGTCNENSDICECVDGWTGHFCDEGGPEVDQPYSPPLPDGFCGGRPYFTTQYLHYPSRTDCLAVQPVAESSLGSWHYRSLCQKRLGLSSAPSSVADAALETCWLAHQLQGFSSGLTVTMHVCCESVDVCAGYDCGSHGSCDDFAGFPQCVCESGWSGPQCETADPVSECETVNCGWSHFSQTATLDGTGGTLMFVLQRLINSWAPDTGNYANFDNLYVYFNCDPSQGIACANYLVNPSFANLISGWTVRAGGVDIRTSPCNNHYLTLSGGFAEVDQAVTVPAGVFSVTVGGWVHNTNSAALTGLARVLVFKGGDVNNLADFLPASADSIVTGSWDGLACTCDDLAATLEPVTNECVVPPVPSACDSEPCGDPLVNQCTAVDDNNFICSCGPGYFNGGYNAPCIDACQFVTCVNGYCTGGQCACYPGYFGTDCSISLTVCDGVDCGVGYCDPLQQGICVCPAGWDGDNCDIDSTLPDPCAVPSTCVDCVAVNQQDPVPNSAASLCGWCDGRCSNLLESPGTCLTAWSTDAQACAPPSSPCDNDPCHTSASADNTCSENVLLPLGYECSCADGWQTGDNLETCVPPPPPCTNDECSTTLAMGNLCVPHDDGVTYHCVCGGVGSGETTLTREAEELAAFEWSESDDQQSCLPPTDFCAVFHTCEDCAAVTSSLGSCTWCAASGTCESLADAANCDGALADDVAECAALGVIDEEECAENNQCWCISADTSVGQCTPDLDACLATGGQYCVDDSMPTTFSPFYSLKLSDNGFEVSFIFGLPTDSALTYRLYQDPTTPHTALSSFSCQLLLRPSTLRLLNADQCYFTDAQTLVVPVGPAATVNIGDVLSIQNNRIRASIPEGVSLDVARDYPTAKNIRAVLAAPANTPPPVAHIAGPTVLGATDDLFLDAVGSLNGMGRPLRFQWGIAVSSALTLAQRAALVAVTRQHTDLSYLSVPANAIPVGVQLTFELTARHWLGGEHSITWTVSKTSANLVIVVLDKTEVHMPAKNKLKVRARARPSPGTGSIWSSVSDGLVFQWVQMDGPALPADVVTNYLETAAGVLKLPKNTLQPGETYKFTVYVSSAEASVSASATVTVYVEASEVYAALVSSTYGVTVGSAVSFDASVSSNGGSNSDGLLFTWSCKPEWGGDCFTGGSAEAQALGTATTNGLFEVDSSSFTGVGIAEVCVSVVRPVPYSEDTACRDVEVHAATPDTIPLYIEVGPHSATHDPKRRLRLRASAVGLRPADFDWTWSSPDFDLSALRTTRRLLRIPRNTMNPGTEYVFVVSAREKASVQTGPTPRTGTAQVKITTVGTVGMMRGQCALSPVSPISGEAFLTEFTFNCFGWAPTSGDVEYRFEVESSGYVLQPFSAAPSFTGTLPSGGVNEGYEQSVKVLVRDATGAMIPFLIPDTVTVAPIPEQTVTDTGGVDALVDAIIDQYIPAAISSYDLPAFAQLFDAVLEKISEVSDAAGVVDRLVTRVSELAAINAGDRVSTLELATQQLQKITEWAGSNADAAMRTALVTLLNDFLEDIVTVAGSGLSFTEQIECQGLVDAASQLIAILSANASILTPEERRALLQSIIETALPSLGRAESVQDSEPSDREFAVGHMHGRVRQESAEDWQGDSITGSNGAVVTFPSDLYAQIAGDNPSLNSDDTVRTDMLALDVDITDFAQGVQGWVPGLNSEVVSVTLFNEDGSPLTVQGLSSPIQFTVPHTAALEAELTAGNVRGTECAWVDFTAGTLSTEGCVVVSVVPTQTVCECVHMTAFVAQGSNNAGSGQLSGDTSFHSLTASAIEENPYPLIVVAAVTVFYVTLMAASGCQAQSAVDADLPSTPQRWTWHVVGSLTRAHGPFTWACSAHWVVLCVLLTTAAVWSTIARYFEDTEFDPQSVGVMLLVGALCGLVVCVLAWAGEKIVWGRATAPSTIAVILSLSVHVALSVFILFLGANLIQDDGMVDLTAEWGTSAVLCYVLYVMWGLVRAHFCGGQRSHHERITSPKAANNIDTAGGDVPIVETPVAFAAWPEENSELMVPSDDDIELAEDEVSLNAVNGTLVDDAATSLEMIRLDTHAKSTVDESGSVMQSPLNTVNDLYTFMNATEDTVEVPSSLAE